LSEKYLGLEPYKDVDYNLILEEPWPKVAAMNAEDVRRTYNLLRPLADQLNQDKDLSRVYQWIIMPAINELIDITITGIPVDRDRFDPLLVEFEAKVTEQRTWLEEFTAEPLEEAYPRGWPKPGGWTIRDNGPWDGKRFNPTSPKQVGHIIYDVWHLPVLELTDTEQPSTNADVLLQLETFHAEGEQEQWLHNLREYRKSNKILTSYLRSWPELWDSSGWMHPRYKPLHTKTGRLSSDQPNIQNVPRAAEFRNLFGGVEGMTWMKADYSQIELRIAAWLSNETLMLQAYEDGLDLHTLTASLVLGDDSPQARQVGKTLNFGLLYGAGAKTLQRVARSDYGVFLTPAEAQEYHAAFFMNYPGLASWQKAQEQNLSWTGISRSPLGRVRYLPNAKIPWHVEDMRTKKIGAIHEGLNHPVQSFASDLLLSSLIRLRPQLKQFGATIVAEVHDEIDLLVPDESVRQVAAVVKETMEDTSWLGRHGISLGVPVLASVETGTHWGSVKEST
jgi:DNA polymerase-1